MDRFQNILVGVDLSDGERPVAEELSDSARSAVDRAFWVARQSDARLTLFSCAMPCLDLSDAGSVVDSQHLREGVSQINDAADRALKRLVDDAREFGVQATAVRRCGRAWMELLRVVEHHEHDLVVVGSHRHHALGEFLLGSTGRRLIRKCPCPVWVTSPHEGGSIRKILATTDLSETADMATELAVSLADRLSAELHVMHAVQYPHESILKVGELVASRLDAYRSAVYDEAEKDFEAMLVRTGAAQIAGSNLRHIVSDDPVHAIESFAREESPDLIVMGTSKHGGLKSFLMGSTAERLLPKLRCSVLAVKPVGFVCPVRFEEEGQPAELLSVASS